MNHKRIKPKIQRAACFCGGKNAKKWGATGMRGGVTYGMSGSSLRLMVRARETA